MNNWYKKAKIELEAAKFRLHDLYPKDVAEKFRVTYENMPKTKNLAPGLQVYDPNDATKKPNQSLISPQKSKELAKTFTDDKLLQRAENWVFYGKDKTGYITVRPQKSGLYKLTGMAGNIRSAFEGFQELMSEGKPVWGLVSKEISSMAVRLGMKALEGPEFEKIMKTLLPNIPKGVFGGVDYSVGRDGKITLHYSDIGDAQKVFICNDEYLQWLKSHIPTMQLPAPAKATLQNFLSGGNSKLLN